MEQEINKQGKTYRITIEAIGPEAEDDVFNNGAPLIIETDGFFIVSCETQENEETIERDIGIVARHISPEEIVLGMTSSDHYDAIKFAMFVADLKRRGKVVEL